MPKPNDMSTEMKKVTTQMEADPTHKFPVVSRINTPTYKKLLEDSIATGTPLTAMIEVALTAYYEQRG